LYNNTPSRRRGLYKHLGFFLILVLTTSFASSVHFDLPVEIGQNKTQLSYTRYIPSILFQTTWGGSGDDSATGVATDPAGNIYVTGTTNSFCCGAFLLKFNSTGSLLWQRVLLPNYNFVSNGLAVDSMGSAYLTGDIEKFNGTGQDILVVKFDSGGNLLWARTWGGNMNDYARAIAVDKYGGVYVTGTTFSFAVSGYSNLVVLKLRSNGSLVWQEIWGDLLYNYGLGITIDSTANIYVSGYTSDSQFYNADPVLLKLNSTGALMWQELWAVSSVPGSSIYNAYTFANAVTLDSSGGVYVTGSSNYNLNGFVYVGVPIIKFNSDGSIAWQKIWIRGPAAYYGPNQSGNALALDSTGDVYIAGQTINYGQDAQSSGVLILEFSPRGDLEWQATTATNNNDAGTGIAINSVGYPIVVGNLYESPPRSLTELNYLALNGNFTQHPINRQPTDTNATLSTLSAIDFSPSGSLTYAGSSDAYILETQPPQPSPPSPPLALVAQAGQSNVSLSWAPSQYTGGHPITGYNVYRGLSAAAETLLASTIMAHGYVDSDVKIGVTYYYYVKAVNSLGESDASNENYATPGVNVAMMIPINPTTVGGASVIVVAIVGFVVYQRRRRTLHFG
jgi:beta-propeller repeat-containing protein/fibronectin type III domain protein